MRRTLVIVGLLLHTLSFGVVFAAAPQAVVIRSNGVLGGTGRAAMLASGAKRSRISKSDIFSTDEIRVRVPVALVGKIVHVAQGRDALTRPASSLFETFQSVEAAHAGHAAEVHVVLDATLRARYGEAFLAAMFSGLEVSSLAFAGPDGVRQEVALTTATDLPAAAPAAAVAAAPLVVWTGSSHPELGAALAKRLDVEEIRAATRQDDRLVDSAAALVAGKRIVLVQTKRMGDAERFHLDLLEMLHRAYQSKRDGAAAVMVVSPYLSYSRSDRMDTPGTAVGAAILPQLMKRAGVDEVVFYSVHQAQEVGIFQALHIQVAHASGELVLAQRVAAHVRDTQTPTAQLKVLAPDAGAAKRARVFARHLEESLDLPASSIDVVVANKERNGNEIRLRFEGDVTGATVIAIDDETASGSTLKEIAAAARANGASSVLGAVSHLTGAAHKKLAGSALDRLFVLDTLPQDELRAAKDHPIEVVPIADHLARIVKGLSTGENVDKLLFFEH